ncbi:MAG: hypothetical protein AAB610_00065 [Patescibacteria group bacterium]
MQAINCVFIEGGGLAENEADALYFFGQHMIKKKLRRIRLTCEEFDTEIVINTQHEFTFFVGVSGIKMTAEINRGSKTVKAEFLVYPTKHIMMAAPGTWQRGSENDLRSRAEKTAALN